MTDETERSEPTLPTMQPTGRVAMIVDKVEMPPSESAEGMKTIVETQEMMTLRLALAQSQFEVAKANNRNSELSGMLAEYHGISIQETIKRISGDLNKHYPGWDKGTKHA